MTRRTMTRSLLYWMVSPEKKASYRHTYEANMRDKLLIIIIGGDLVCGKCLVIPLPLRKDVLNRLERAHMDAAKTKAPARFD